jgi:hypothetical protein|tara:strand:+ start:343 stop:519 length:177 start_codon:yes stop_codon:yes gene_type:complete
MGSRGKDEYTMSLPGYDAWLEAPYTDAPDACENCDDEGCHLCDKEEAYLHHISTDPRV